VTPDGQPSLPTNLPGDLFPSGLARPNGIAYHGGWLYVVDSILALVWWVHSEASAASAGASPG